MTGESKASPNSSPVPPCASCALAVESRASASACCARAPANCVLRPASSSWVTRSEEHTSELQSLMRISYAVFCLKKQKIARQKPKTQQQHIYTKHNTRT